MCKKPFFSAVTIMRKNKTMSETRLPRLSFIVLLIASGALLGCEEKEVPKVARFCASVLGSHLAQYHAQPQIIDYRIIDSGKEIIPGTNTTVPENGHGVDLTFNSWPADKDIPNPRRSRCTVIDTGKKLFLNSWQIDNGKMIDAGTAGVPWDKMLAELDIRSPNVAIDVPNHKLSVGLDYRGPLSKR